MKVQLLNRAWDASVEDEVETGNALVPDWIEAGRVRELGGMRSLSIEIDIKGSIERLRHAVVWRGPKSGRPPYQLFEPLVQAHLVVGSFGPGAIAISIDGRQRLLSSYGVPFRANGSVGVAGHMHSYVWLMHARSASLRELVATELLRRIRRSAPSARLVDTVPMAGFWVRTDGGYAMATWVTETLDKRSREDLAPLLRLSN